MFQAMISATTLLLCAASATATAGQLELTPITAGTGINSSYVQVDFDSAAAGGDTVLFEVFWNSAPSGFEMLETLESEAGLTLDADFFDFDGDGNFTDALVSELGYGGDSHTGGLTEFWTYWTRDDALAPWAPAMVGVSDRIAAHGSWDGWTFGEFAQYEPRAVTIVPTPGGLAVVVSGLFIARRRRR